MYSLFVDQSYGEGIFGLFYDGHVVDVISFLQRDAMQSCAIFQKLLTAHGLQLSGIEFFVCGIGPGSYTGVRTAAATIKGIAFTVHKPIIAMSSLFIMLPEQPGHYLVILDAKIGGAYVQEISIDEKFCCAMPAELVSIENLMKRATREVTLIVTSVDWLIKKGITVEHLSTIQRQEVVPNLISVARIAYQKWKVKEYYTAFSLPLTYLRKTQAEIEVYTHAT